MESALFFCLYGQKLQLMLHKYEDSDTERLFKAFATFAEHIGEVGTEATKAATQQTKYIFTIRLFNLRFQDGVTVLPTTKLCVVMAGVAQGNTV